MDFATNVFIFHDGHCRLRFYRFVFSVVPGLHLQDAVDNLNKTNTFVHANGLAVRNRINSRALQNAIRTGVLRFVV